MYDPQKVKKDPNNPHFETQKYRMRPQDGVPTERIVHNIVKDYQRMFNGFHAMRERAEKAEEMVKEYQEKCAKLRSDNAKLQKDYKKNIEDVRSSRDAVVKDVTEELQERVDFLTKQNKFLAQAVIEPEKVDLLLNKLNEPMAFSSDDEVLLEAMKQLEKALIRMTAIEGRLADVENLAKQRDYTEKEMNHALTKFNKAFGKIDSATSRIENFFDKIGEIRIEKKTEATRT